MRTITTIFYFAVAIFMISETGSAQRVWEYNGAPVCTAPHHQGEFGKPMVMERVPAEPGGPLTQFVCVWHDERDGLGDIYAQRFDVNGQELWESNGKIVCNAPGEQRLPKIIACYDPPILTGEVIIVWIDGRDYPTKKEDVYIQKLNSDGDSMWASNGIPVSNTEDRNSWPGIVTDRAGGAIVVWRDDRNDAPPPNDYGWDLYAQRIDGGGGKLWTSEESDNSVPVCRYVRDQIMNNFSLVSDGACGVIVGWADYRYEEFYPNEHPLSNSDVYASRLDGADGAALWGDNGIAVCERPNSKQSYKGPMVCTDGEGGAILVWADRRNYETSGWDVYTQRMLSTGFNDWPLNGRPACDAQGDQGIREDGEWMANDEETLHIALSGDDPVTAWVDWRQGAGVADIYAQRQLRDQSGAPQWDGSSGRAACAADHMQYMPLLAEDGEGGTFVVWHDERSGDHDVYCQHIDFNGVTLWRKDGYCVCVLEGEQVSPSIVYDTKKTVDATIDGVIINWKDDRNKYEVENNDLYMQKLEVGECVSDEYGYHHLSPGHHVAVKAGQVVFATWFRNEPDDNRILFDSADKADDWAWEGNRRVDEGLLTDERKDPAIAARWPVAGDANVFVAWVDYRDDDSGEIYFHRSTDGGDTWDVFDDLCLASPSQIGGRTIDQPTIAVDGDGDEVIVVFRGRTQDETDSSLYYVTGAAPFESWDPPQRVLPANDNDCHSPCIHGMEGEDFGVLWVEEVTIQEEKYDHIKWGKFIGLVGGGYDFVLYEWPVNDELYANHHGPCLEYAPPRETHPGTWYAVFVKATGGEADGDIYLHRYDEGGSWDTGSMINEAGKLTNCPSLHVKRQFFPPEGDWFDYIVISYDRKTESGEGYEIFVNAKAKRLGSPNDYMDRGTNLIPSLTERSHSQVFIIDLPERLGGVLWRYYDSYGGEQSGGEGIYWSTTCFED